MWITADRIIGSVTRAKARLPLLTSPLAALLYPFALKGFHASVMRISQAGAGGLVSAWLSSSVYLGLAFAMPLIAMLAAMSLSRLSRPTPAQLLAKRTALLAVAAPTLFTFVGVVLSMLHDPVPDTWLWIPCWTIAIALLLGSDNEVPARLAMHLVPAPLRVAHGVSALVLVMTFLALHITNHLMFPAGRETYEAVMKAFRHVYRTDIVQPLLVALFLFQVGTGLFFVWRLTATPSDRFRTQVLHMRDAPAIETYIVRNSDKPGGIGEPGTCAVMPAIANAIFAATGERLQRLPVDPAQLREA